MEYREFTCIVCGVKGIDMSKSKNKKFCSSECRHLFEYRKKSGVKNADSCIHNQGIACEIRNCVGCGWNPDVAQKRKEAFAYG